MSDTKKASQVSDDQFVKAYIAVTKLENGHEDMVAEMVGLKPSSVKVRAATIRKKLREAGVADEDNLPKMPNSGRGRRKKDWSAIAKMVQQETAREALSAIDEIESELLTTDS